MSDATVETSFTDLVAAELPYLRRYTRALTGSQTRGDKYTVATLEMILKDRSPFDNDDPIKVEDTLRSRAHGLLAKLTPNSREALLLRTIEEFTVNQIALIMQTDAEEVRQLIKTANAELSASVKGRVMIIEDEPIIAADLKGAPIPKRSSWATKTCRT